MPLVDPVYQIKVNPNDGFRRSWDPSGLLASLLVDKTNTSLTGHIVFLDKALQIVVPNLGIVSKDIGYQSDAVVTNPVISTVNNNQDVPITGAITISNIEIVGSDFGAVQGTVALNNHLLTITSWGDQQIFVDWPDIPFIPTYNDTQMGTQQDVTVTRADAEFDTRGAVSIAAAAAGEHFGAITSIPTNSIYFDDIDVVVGDEAYIRVIVGSVDTVNVNTGVLEGIAPGTQVEYAIWDTSVGVWVI